MTQLSPEEYIEMGLSLPTLPLMRWVTEQVIEARARERRLARRGISDAYLEEMEVLFRTVAGLQVTIGEYPEDPIPREVAQAQQTRDEATAYCLEVKHILLIEFGTCPEIQVQCRLGVRTGRLLENMCREVAFMVGVLREHSSQLRWLGADDAFISAGDGLLGKLKEAQVKLALARTLLSPVVVAQSVAKGQLYDLTRKLVRIGKLDFLHEPEQASVFNYDALRRELRAGSEVRAMRVKTVLG